MGALRWGCCGPGQHVPSLRVPRRDVLAWDFHTIRQLPWLVLLEAERQGESEKGARKLGGELDNSAAPLIGPSPNSLALCMALLCAEGRRWAPHPSMRSSCPALLALPTTTSPGPPNHSKRAMAAPPCPQVDIDSVRRLQKDNLADVLDAVQSGLATAGPSGAAKRQPGAAAAAAPADKRRRIDPLLEVESDFEDSEDESEEEQEGEGIVGPTPAAAPRQEEQQQQQQGQSLAVTEGKGLQQLESVQEQLQQEQQVQQQDEGAAAASKEAAVEAPAPAPAAEPAAAPAEESGAIDLSRYGSAQELEVLGLDRLKAELARLGLKCGGDLKQRAARLFLLRDTPLEKLGRKHFAAALPAKA